MIRFVLFQNKQGKTRLSKWYQAFSTDEKRTIEREVHRIVTRRDKNFTNFVEYQTYKLIYRRYVGLYVILCVDVNDNELSYLESIHLFVELLDQFFGNVCEQDLVMYFHKVYALMDEYYLAGEIQETNKSLIVSRVLELEKLE